MWWKKKMLRNLVNIAFHGQIHHTLESPSKFFKLNQQLTYTNIGRYVATCNLKGQQ